MKLYDDSEANDGADWAFGVGGLLLIALMVAVPVFLVVAILR